MSDLRVMVVEDNEYDMAMITAALEAAGIDHRAVSQSINALEVAIEYKPSIALLDLNMPELSGREVLQQLHTHPMTNHIKVIFLSATDCVDDVLYGLNVHVSAYFRKGIKVQKLVNSINNLDASTRMRKSINLFSAQNQRLADKYTALVGTH